jgi:glycine/D-amino acid oxidase-like deaminating enzyme
MKTLFEPAWQIKKPISFPALSHDISAETIIIGGGLTGLLTAYQLKQEGKDAIIIEKGEIGSGATHLTTAFLTQIIDTDFSELISLFGSKNTQSIWTSHGAAIDLIENISKKEKINCDFLRCPAFFYAHTKSDVLNIAEIHQAAKKIGVKSEVIHPPLQGFKNFGGLKFENQAQYHPLKFLYGLAAVLKKNGHNATGRKLRGGF